jgi:hypothetical protein
MSVTRDVRIEFERPAFASLIMLSFKSEPST